MTQALRLTILFIAACLAAIAPCRLGGQPAGSSDIYALMEVVWDLPAGFTAWPQKNRTPGEPTNATESNHAYGTAELPPANVYSQPTRKDVADVRIWVKASQYDALGVIAPDNPRYHFNLRPVYGSFSGKKIGEFCAHATVGSPNPFGAGLWFVHNNIAYYMDLRGPVKDGNWRRSVEAIAAALIARADAEGKLSAAKPETAAVRGRTIPCRAVNGNQMVHIKQFADAIGATATLDPSKGIAEVRMHSHLLQLHIGTRTAVLDRKPIELGFPALRDGKDNIYCPLSTLKLIGT